MSTTLEVDSRELLDLLVEPKAVQAETAALEHVIHRFFGKQQGLMTRQSATSYPKFLLHQAIPRQYMLRHALNTAHQRQNSSASQIKSGG